MEALANIMQYSIELIQSIRIMLGAQGAFPIILIRAMHDRFVILTKFCMIMKPRPTEKEIPKRMAQGLNKIYSRQFASGILV